MAMIRWPILAIFWNGYPPSQITGSTNCCRTTGGPLNNKRTKPTKRAGSTGVYRMDTVEHTYMAMLIYITIKKSRIDSNFTLLLSLHTIVFLMVFLRCNLIKRKFYGPWLYSLGF